MKSRTVPKQFLKLYGKPVIIHTIEVFEHHPEIDAIVVACIASGIPHLQNLIREYGIKKVKSIVSGGNTGQESIYHGLCAAEELADGKPAVVLIHDGVRPLIDSESISRNIKSVLENGSAITCVKVKETVLVVSTEEDNQIDSVPARKDTRLARAPQSFWLESILRAHRKAIQERKLDFIDSCSLMQYYGERLYLVEGPEENIKITTPEDFYAMRAILEAKENAQLYGYDEPIDG